MNGGVITTFHEYPRPKAVRDTDTQTKLLEPVIFQLLIQTRLPVCIFYFCLPRWEDLYNTQKLTWIPNIFFCKYSIIGPLRKDASSLKTSKIHFICGLLTLKLKKLHNYFPSEYLFFLTTGLFFLMDTATLRTHVERSKEMTGFQVACKHTHIYIYIKLPVA